MSNVRSSAKPAAKKITAVVLAAGQAKRMGTAKQLLPWGKTTVLGQTIEHLKQSNCSDILVVTGAYVDEVNKIAHRLSVPTVFNPNYAEGEMLSSLQTAVAHLHSVPDAILVALADQPLILPETYNAIMLAFADGHSLVAPFYQQRRGNPVLIGQRYFEELLALPLGDAPRTLLKRHAAQLHAVEIQTDTILIDLDRPDVYQKWHAYTFSNHID